ncbi:hypothetical protein MKZ38_006586 [Zalerion maritima]|uniref:Uncharacterized protein n=1 Tax=Zalerion maritima TaxID=339359 RepID=A0AAD5RJF4_9PEZI|nr:hypothetical protein MKZ38_006586 [Zalerion maritima]
MDRQSGGGGYSNLGGNSGGGSWLPSFGGYGGGSGSASTSPELEIPRQRPSSVARKPVPLTSLPPKRPAAAAFGGSSTVGTSSSAFSPTGPTVAPSLVSNLNASGSSSGPSPAVLPAHKRQTSFASSSQNTASPGTSPPQQFPFSSTSTQYQSPYQSQGQSSPYQFQGQQFNERAYETPTVEQLEQQESGKGAGIPQQSGLTYSNAYFAVPDSETPKGKDTFDGTPRFDDNFTEQSPKPFFGESPQYARLGQHQRNDSNSHLLNPQLRLQHVNTPPPFGYADPYEHKIPFWHKEWLLYLLFFIGIFGAIGHHFFYQSLHGQEAKEQRTMLRYGSVLSFLVKASLSSVAVLAFRQRVWVTVRRKMLSLEAIDALFAATEDLSSMANTEIVSNARIALLLALFVWCTPLIVILTSETLSVELQTHEVYGKCSGIRTLNFTHEGLQDWREGVKINGQYLLSTSLWNTTGGLTAENSTEPTQAAFDYYTARSSQFEQVGVVSLYSGTALSRVNASNEICGVGWNCSYSLEFVAPGYNCSTMAEGVGSEVRSLNGVKSPITIDSLLPSGNYSYAVHAFLGDYENPQIYNVSDTPVQTGGIPPEMMREENGDWPELLGSFRTEPVIWAGFSEPEDPDKEAILDRSDPDFESFYTPKVIACEHRYTKYKVTITYNSTVQSHNVTSREYLGRVIDTDYAGNTTQEAFLNDNTTATPEDNYVYPIDLFNYKQTAGYHSMGSLFREYINNTIAFNGLNIIAETKAVATRLVERKDYLIVPNFEEELVKAYEEMVFSLFNDPFFVANSWAAAPAEMSGDLAGDEERLQYPCQRSRVDNVFHYHALNLWAVYGISILLTVGAVSFGLLAVSENDGVVRDTQFSSIVAATRGPHLNGVDWALKDGQVSKRVKRIRVGYGVVHEAQMSGLGIQEPGYGFDRRKTFSPHGPDSPSAWTVPIFGFGVDGGVRQRRRPRSFTFRTPTRGQGRFGAFQRDSSGVQGT